MTAKKKTVRQVLVAAYRLIVKGWTRHAMARNKDGCIVDYTSSEAVEFCSYGAISRAAGGTTNPHLVPLDVIATAREAARCLKVATRRTDIPAWQNAEKRTKRQVLAAFSRAIKLAGKR